MTYPGELFTDPKKIKEHLDDYVIGQEKAKESLAVAVSRHYRKARIRENNGEELEKSNILLVGPTGSGKTYLVETLSKVLGVPLVSADANQFTASGYVGRSVGELPIELMEKAQSPEHAARGIIYLDEIDKLAQHETGKDHVGKNAVQEALLTMVQGNEYACKDSVSLNTKTVLFIVSGAFSDMKDLTEGYYDGQTLSSQHFIDYGMKPEFIGRFPQVIQLKKLTTEDLMRILVEPKKAPVKQLQRELAEEGLTLEITRGALKLISEYAAEKDLGARSLLGVVNEVTLPIFYDIESYRRSSSKKVKIDTDYVHKQLKKVHGGTPKPSVTDEQSPPGEQTPPPLVFQWKDAELKLPGGANLALLDKSPEPHLAKLLASSMLMGKPAIGYKKILDELRLTNMKALFNKLTNLQRWCMRNRFFDLTALVVGKAGTPGRGFYGADCKDEYEWKKYLACADKALL